MIWTHVVVIGVLFTVGTYLLLQRALTRVVIGLAVLAHGANLVLLTGGGPPGRAPILESVGRLTGYADPLPQALALTAIVITFGMTALLLALAYRSWQLTQHDEVQDDLEDRRVARDRERGEEV